MHHVVITKNKYFCKKIRIYFVFIIIFFNIARKK
jgi:hypothetical protein